MHSKLTITQKFSIAAYYFLYNEFNSYHKIGKISILDYEIKSSKTGLDYKYAPLEGGNLISQS